MTHILALIDGSTYTHSVCDHAAWAAHQYGGDIELLHVLRQEKAGSLPSDLSGAIGLGARSSLLADLADHDAASARLAKERGRAILDAAQSRLEEHAIPEISLALRHGDIADTLSKRAGDLIVMGKRGEGANFDKLHLGSNLERVIRCVNRPVLVTSRAFKPIKTVLFAFDNGISTRKALTSLTTTPMAERPKIIVLMVGTETSEHREAAKSATDALCAAGYTAQMRIIPGHAETVITEEVAASGSDLLIMGAYGHSRIRSMIIGSTTTSMIQSCLVPLLLFR